MVPTISDCVIMAGGSGTRLWPASTRSKPKQFLSLPSGVIAAGKLAAGTPARANEGARTAVSVSAAASVSPGGTFLGAAVERAMAVIGDSDGGRVIIIAGREHIQAIEDECAKLDDRERRRLVVIPEPLAKNTAPAIACALVYIDRMSPGNERSVLVLTSDHIIEPLDVFAADAHAAAAAAHTGKLAVFGIRPTRPETGYGYIEAAGTLTGRPDERGGRRSEYEPEVFSVASFREKPDAEKARRFIAEGNFYWNSGMFAFSSKFMLDEFRRTAPEVIAPFRELTAPSGNSHRTRGGLNVLDEWDGLEQAYLKTKAISFDYAVAEKCAATVMVKAGFSWSDVGSWDEYARLAKQPRSEVYAAGESPASCFVDSDIPVALCAVEDLVVVVRSGKDGGPPAVLISKKGETQRVKEIVEKIKTAGRTELL